jgi:hypothetical protein
MPSFRRVISRFMNPKKKRRRKRRKRGLRALLSRFMVQSRFMQPPQASKSPKPRQDAQKTPPLTPRFRNKNGPNM